MAQRQLSDKEKSLVDKVVDSLEKLVDDWTTLRVITLVADSPIKTVPGSNAEHETVAKIEIDGTHHGYVTEIKITDGDTLNILPPVDKRDDELATTHQASVQHAATILPDNLEAIGNAAGAILRAIRGEG